MDEQTTIRVDDEVVETCNWQGHEYVGLYVSPRGFGNEFSVYVVNRDDADRIAVLAGKRNASRNRQTGDAYRATWLDRKELAQHIASSRGHIVMTVTPTGDTDAVTLPSESPRLDTLQPLILARVKARNLSAYAVAKLCHDRPGEDAVKRYLDGRASLNSAYVSAIMRALGWDGKIGWE